MLLQASIYIYIYRKLFMGNAIIKSRRRRGNGGWTSAGFAVVTTIVGAAVFAAAPAQAAVTVSDWTQLQAAVTNATTDTVILDANISAPQFQNLVLDVGDNITLDLRGHWLRVDEPQAGKAGVSVPDSATFTVEDTSGGGSLSAQGGIAAGPEGGGAGIGGDTHVVAGSIIINSGRIVASGGGGGAGIGGGADGLAPAVTINGGTVEAYGSGAGNNAGAGIGYGSGIMPGPQALVTITGGDVLALGAGGAAGIGGGTSSPVANVTITGGKIRASGAAGIGGTDSSSPGPHDLFIAGTPTSGSATDGAGPNGSPITAQPRNGAFFTAVTNTDGDTFSFELTFEYTVVFDSTGGSSVATQTVLSGGTATEPETPTRPGFTFTGWVTSDDQTYDFTSPVTDPVELSATWDQVMGTPPMITTTTLPTGTKDKTYTAPVEATGTGPITFTITAGTLPTGITLDPTTGVLSGTPTQTGSSTFTVTATNTDGQDSREYTITIDDTAVVIPPAPTPTPTPTPVHGAGLATTGGSAPWGAAIFGAMLAIAGASTLLVRKLRTQ